jgi:transposase
VRSSLPASQQLILEAVEETADGIVFRVRGKHTPRCPSCFQSRVSYHSRYMRRMRDLPWQGTDVLRAITSQSVAPILIGAGAGVFI